MIKPDHDAGNNAGSQPHDKGQQPSSSNKKSGQNTQYLEASPLSEGLMQRLRAAFDQGGTPDHESKDHSRHNAPENTRMEPPHEIMNTPAPKPTKIRVPVKQKVIVKKYGVMASIFRPMGVAVALLFFVYSSLSIGLNYWHGYKRDLAYSQTRHIDKTAVEFLQSSSLSKDRVELTILNFNGKLEKRLASRSQLKARLQESAATLDQAKNETNKKMQAELETLFTSTFADRDEAINNYANWFFEWKRPYVILKEAITSTTTRLIKLGEYESLRTAVERDIKDYFIDNYKTQVLKPEQRDALLIAGIEKIARSAHQQYREVMVAENAKMRAFIANNTTYLESVAEGGTLTTTSLDWNAQKWQTPLYLMEDRAFDGIAGMGRVAAGGTIGALALGPAVGRGLGSVFGPLSGRFAASMGARITLAEGGALAGTAVEPVAGTVVGAAIGVVLGFAADYVINKLNEKFSRENFLTANREALDNTITLWQGKIEENMSASFNIWYDSAKAGLLITNKLDMPAENAEGNDQQRVDSESSDKSKNIGSDKLF